MGKVLNKFDDKLNEHGEWLLVGAIACFSLPPMLCTISAIFLLVVRLGKHDCQSKDIKLNILRKQIADSSKRNILTFKIGNIFIWLAIFYGLYKMLLIQSKNGGHINYDWFIKVFWGGL